MKKFLLLCMVSWMLSSTMGSIVTANRSVPYFNPELRKTAASNADCSMEHVVAGNRDAEKCIALTFDDGPHIKYTDEILDILEQYGAKATFFVIGQNAEKYPDIIQREFAEGHEIGNHTYSHPSMKKITVEKIMEEISKTQDIIFDITGEKPRLFRSPGGYFNNDIIHTIEDLDCLPILWSWRQDTRDWTMPSVDSIVNTVMKNLQDGDIVLFHDFNREGSPTPKALKILLPKLKEMGYRFVTVSELISISDKTEQ